MKKILLFLFIIPFISLSQINQDNNPTTHYYDWGYNTANQQINIEVGDTVEWTWVGGGNHNLVSTSGTESFDSGYGSAGKKFSYTFNNIGSTDFVCTPHAGNMFGTVTVSNSLSLIPEKSVEKINIYPNPATDELMVIGLESGALVEIFDLNGRAVRNENYLGSVINLSGLKPGVYQVVINGEVSEKLLVE